jgi:hypothetical protein
MAEMKGKELSKRVLVRHPEFKLLYMSDYTADGIARHGVLGAGMHFFRKPFLGNDFAARVRAVWDEQGVKGRPLVSAAQQGQGGRLVHNSYCIRRY